MARAKYLISKYKRYAKTLLRYLVIYSIFTIVSFKTLGIWGSLLAVSVLTVVLFD